VKQRRSPYGKNAPGRLHVALGLLLQGYDHARARRLPTFDFAVEVGEPQKLGLTRADFRLLVSCGYIRHVVETAHGRVHRRFKRASPLSIDSRSCAILSEQGAVWARNVLTMDDAQKKVSEMASTPDKSARRKLVQPSWDAKRQRLFLGSTLVRCFRRPAPRQSLILTAFQEQGWPDHIDDPLPCQNRRSPKRRLHQTITDLNRGQRPLLIRFEGDGTGRGICWKPVSPGES
jgi:hypothetical protein